MTYVIIIQGSKVTATCFSDHKCWLHDGAISIGWINSQSKMQEIHHGELTNGEIRAITSRNIRNVCTFQASWLIRLRRSYHARGTGTNATLILGFLAA